jgi:hypothetical protein
MCLHQSFLLSAFSASTRALYLAAFSDDGIKNIPQPVGAHGAVVFLQQTLQNFLFAPVVCNLNAALFLEIADLFCQ